MPLQIVRNDITRMRVDAVVNAAKPSLLGGGGVDGAIHKVAGPELVRACRKLGRCRPGEAKITEGFQLPAKYVVHTVGPVWHGGTRGEAETLSSCYRSCLNLAWEYCCESIAFPLISAGAYGYPADQAMHIATETIRDFLRDHDMNVYMVVFGAKATDLGRQMFPGLKEYIDDHYAERLESIHRRNAYPTDSVPETSRPMNSAPPLTAPYPVPKSARPKRVSRESSGPIDWNAQPAADTLDMTAFNAPDFADTAGDLTRVLRSLDESFQQMLLRKISESGMTDPQCYKKANLDRKLFSKIRSDVHYQPSKRTALALAVALELGLPETEELLRKAGYALSRSNVSDVIIEYFIQRRIYDIFIINEALFAWDQVPLGG